jgi:hypothetical protein
MFYAHLPLGSRRPAALEAQKYGGRAGQLRIFVLVELRPTLLL